MLTRVFIFIQIMSWELFIVLFLFIMAVILINPSISMRTFLAVSEFQINSLRFFIVFLRIFTFFWALRCRRLFVQVDSFFSLLKLFNILLLFLIVFFLVEKLLNLYLFFELSVVPIFIIIVGWGYQTERLGARLRLIFYTISASLPLLIILLWLNKILFLNRILLLFFFKNCSELRLVFILGLTAAFLVKLPIFGVHIWLPKAHVEAPIFGSIILAAILLKLGRYGIWLFIPKIFHFLNFNWFFSLRIIGAVLVSLICIRLRDLKIIIAYSSVRHMGLVLIALIVFNFSGSLGGLILILAHGPSSSAMFLISYYLYQFNYSRRLMLTKGILVRTSVLPLLWFLILITNMAAPPSFNLGSEIIVIRRVMNFLNYNWIYLSLIVFLRTVYTLIIYSSSTQGVKIVFFNFKILNLAETLSILNHLIWGFILVLRITIFTV